MGDFEFIRAINPARKAQWSDQTSTTANFGYCAAIPATTRCAFKTASAQERIAAQRAYTKGGQENIWETKN